MSKRVAIIGAGIAGLSAGVYARLNGFEVDLFEAHTLPGGLCTAWKREGFVIDGCIHWLAGSGPRSPFHALWREVGALPGRTIVTHEAFMTSRGTDGQVLTLWADPDRLERHLTELSPQDAATARELCDLVRAVRRFKAPVDKAPELFNVVDIARLLPRMWPIRKEWAYCARTTIGEFADRFRDPLIRAGLRASLQPEFQLMALVHSLAEMANGSAGYPIGGSLPLARSIEKRCKQLGARVHYGTAVRRILLAAGRVRGVELADGRTHDADLVISAADLRATLDKLLEGRFPSPRHEALFEGVRLYPPMVQVSFGLSRVFAQEVDSVSRILLLDAPREFAGERRETLMWKTYNHDPTLAPEGKSIVTSLVPTSFEYWDRLRGDRTAYDAAKVALAAEVRSALDAAMPGFADAVQVVDVATPLTYERYTSTYGGRFMTWMDDGKHGRDLQMIPKTVPNVEGLYLAGMWLMAPGGLPVALKTARDVVQIICKREGIRFETAMPEAAATVATQEDEPRA